MLSQLCGCLLSPNPTSLIRAAPLALENTPTKPLAEPTHLASKHVESPAKSLPRGRARDHSWHVSRHFIVLTYLTYCLPSPALAYSSRALRSQPVSLPLRNLPLTGLSSFVICSTGTQFYSSQFVNIDLLTDQN